MDICSRTYLFICSTFLLLRDFLIDIEDPRDGELHAVKVISNHSPQLVQTRVTGFCNLEADRCDSSVQLTRHNMGHFKLNFVYNIVLFLRKWMRMLKGIFVHLYNLPWHVQDAPRSSTEEASQAGGGPVSYHPSPYRLGLPIQKPPSLLSLLPLSQLQLPLFFMVAEPQQNFLL